jgi:hypothetical protein
MKRVSLSCIVVALLVICGAAHAAIWYVHPDSTLNSIQVALDGCSANDTVLVGHGIYYENILWPNVQGVDLISEYGPATTIIDGDSAGVVISVYTGVDTTTIISGFTICNGYLLEGGGIFCSESSPTIHGNMIANNVTYVGGGICCLYNASPRITDNTIIGNIAYCWGGGIYCCFESAPIINNNIISGNTAAPASHVGYIDDGCSDIVTTAVIRNKDTSRMGYNGGGIACNSDCSPIIINNSITNNTTVGGGGGIYCDYSGLSSIIDNIIAGNTAAVGGGICCDWYSADSIAGNIISGNTAVKGGGICCYESSPCIVNNSITNNTAAHDSGGGVYCRLNAVPTISSCNIANNTGDGVYCREGSEPLINHCNIYDNTSYGVRNDDPSVIVNAENNWWGDSTGPFHPTTNPGGLGDSVSDYVDFTPWLHWPIGVEEQTVVKSVEKHGNLQATVFSGPLQLPEGEKCRVFDITGRVVEPTNIARGIYFVEIDNKIVQKVVKIR